MYITITQSHNSSMSGPLHLTVTPVGDCLISPFVLSTLLMPPTGRTKNYNIFSQLNIK